MKMETVVYCVVALILGMLLANMLKNVCGCNTVEGFSCEEQCANIIPSEDWGPGNCVVECNSARGKKGKKGKHAQKRFTSRLLNHLDFATPEPV